nr:hypothetical protein [Tanacetum cinerariifolium]
EGYKSFPMILRLFSDLLGSFICLLVDLVLDSLPSLKLSLGSCIYRVWNLVMWDTAYYGSWIRRIALQFIMVSCEVKARIRRIFLMDTPYLLDGYDVLR